MKINGRNFNFGRCIKIDILQGNKKTLTIEHKPEIDPDYYVAMDVSVTDMPSARASDKPGFQAKVTIFNPSKEVLTKIAAGATWLSSYVSEETQRVIANTASSAAQATKVTGMKQYYASRLHAHVYAGYVVNGVPSYTRIIDGIVMGSSFSHKGTDDVLTIGIFDIDPTATSPDIVDPEDEELAKNAEIHKGSPTETKWYNSETSKFADTWHNTLIKYVQNFETDFITDDGNFKIVYVKSLNAWLQAKSKKQVFSSILNPNLEQRLKAQQMRSGGIAAYNLAGMLDGLCANAEVRVDWLKETENVSANTYVIYPLGEGKTIVRGNNANIQIWNYQNLLETPSIDGAGKMTIKMVFNPQCVCNKTIALMLDKNLGQTDVTRNIASFESSIVKDGGMIGSMSSTGNDAAVANNQITGNTNIASQRKGTQDAWKMGYLFNTGFPIIRVEHSLSTYGPNWTTTVKTVPTAGGIKFEG